MKRVVIIEDETMLRDLLAELLKNFPLCTLAGTYGDGLEGWKGLQKIKPDMVVLDIKLPSLNGLEILRRCASNCPTAMSAFQRVFLHRHGPPGPQSRRERHH